MLIRLIQWKPKERFPVLAVEVLGKADPEVVVFATDDDSYILALADRHKAKLLHWALACGASTSLLIAPQRSLLFPHKPKSPQVKILLKSEGRSRVPAVLVNDLLSMLYMRCGSDTWRTLTCYGAKELEKHRSCHGDCCRACLIEKAPKAVPGDCSVTACKLTMQDCRLQVIASTLTGKEANQKYGLCDYFGGNFALWTLNPHLTPRKSAGSWS